VDHGDQRQSSGPGRVGPKAGASGGSEFRLAIGAVGHQIFIDMIERKLRPADGTVLCG